MIVRTLLAVLLGLLVATPTVGLTVTTAAHRAHGKARHTGLGHHDHGRTAWRTVPGTVADDAFRQFLAWVGAVVSDDRIVVPAAPTSAPFVPPRA